MSESGRILLELFVAFLAAKAAGEAFGRLRLPAVAGEVLVGVALGPSLLGWVRPDVTMQTVATLGAIVLLFEVGLSTRISELLRVGRTALLVAVLGVIVPFAGGYAVLAAFGFPTPAALFGGAALVATSVGVTARVLSDAGLSSTRQAHIVLAAAVADDILGLLVLAVVAGVGRGRLDLLRLLAVAVEAVAFVVFQFAVAPRLVRKSRDLVERLRIEDAPLTVALIILLGLSALAEVLGLAAIVGAFFAGLAFAETAERWSLRERVRPLYGFLVPFFFVVAGVQVDLRVLAMPAVLVPGLVLVIVAVLTKIAGCGLGAISEGWRGALAVGIGMVPRGEVGLIVAAVGLTLHALPAAVYAMVVLVAISADLIASPLVRPAFLAAGGCKMNTP
jgi:Kef-type K+ transport system membrane component KefB